MTCSIVIILEFDWNRKWGPDISFFLRKRVVQFERDVSWATNVGVAVLRYYCDKFRQNCVILRPSTKYLRFLGVTTLVRDQRTHLYYYTKIWHYITTEKNFFNVSILYFSHVFCCCIECTFNWIQFCGKAVRMRRRHCDIQQNNLKRSSM